MHCKVLLFRAISFGTFFSCGGRNDQDLPPQVEILDRIISDAAERTGIDGFMIDWFYQPPRPKDVPRLESDVQRYEELMGNPFPTEKAVYENDFEDYNAYSRKAIAACWDVMQKAAKVTDPDCIIWFCPGALHIAILSCDLIQNNTSPLGVSQGMLYL